MKGPRHSRAFCVGKEPTRRLRRFPVIIPARLDAHRSSVTVPHLGDLCPVDEAHGRRRAEREETLMIAVQEVQEPRAIRARLEAQLSGNPASVGKHDVDGHVRGASGFSIGRIRLELDLGHAIFRHHDHVVSRRGHREERLRLVQQLGGVLRPGSIARPRLQENVALERGAAGQSRDHAPAHLLDPVFTIGSGVKV